MTCTLPQDQLTRVTPDLLRAYLEGRGWRNSRPDYAAADTQYFHPGISDPVMAILRVPPSLNARVTGDIVEVLSRAEDRCPRAVLADVLGEGEAARIEAAVKHAEIVLEVQCEGCEEDENDRAETILEIEALEAENARLRAALEEIAEGAFMPHPMNSWDTLWKALERAHQRAREALNQEQG